MDDKDLPNFMRPKKLQECKDREMWSKQFRIAFYLLWAVSIISFVFFDQFGLALAFLGGAGVILVTDSILDVRHLMWHVKNNEEGKHNK